MWIKIKGGPSGRLERVMALYRLHLNSGTGYSGNIKKQRDKKKKNGGRNKICRVGNSPFLLFFFFFSFFVPFPFPFASFPSTSVASRYVAEKFVAHTRLRGIYIKREREREMNKRKRRIVVGSSQHRGEWQKRNLFQTIELQEQKLI